MTRVRHSGPEAEFCVLCLSGEHERVTLGCCDACGGHGGTIADGECSDCRGTGHPHNPDPNCTGRGPS